MDQVQGYRCLSFTRRYKFYVVWDISQSLLTLPVARVFDHTSYMCFDVKVNLKMPWTKRKAIVKGNGCIPHDRYKFGELTMAEIYRVLKQVLDRTVKLL